MLGGIGNTFGQVVNKGINTVENAGRTVIAGAAHQTGDVMQVAQDVAHLAGSKVGEKVAEKVKNEARDFENAVKPKQENPAPKTNNKTTDAPQANVPPPAASTPQPAPAAVAPRPQPTPVAAAAQTAAQVTGKPVIAPDHQTKANTNSFVGQGQGQYGWATACAYQYSDCIGNAFNTGMTPAMGQQASMMQGFQFAGMGMPNVGQMGMMPDFGMPMQQPGQSCQSQAQTCSCQQPAQSCAQQQGQPMNQSNQQQNPGGIMGLMQMMMQMMMKMLTMMMGGQGGQQQQQPQQQPQGQQFMMMGIQQKIA